MDKIILLWFWEDYKSGFPGYELKAVCSSVERAKEFVSDRKPVWIKHNNTECARTGMSAWTIETVTLNNLIMQREPEYPGKKEYDLPTCDLIKHIESMPKNIKYCADCATPITLDNDSG